jgi:hypothetical protein
MVGSLFVAKVKSKAQSGWCHSQLCSIKGTIHNLCPHMIILFKNGSSTALVIKNATITSINISLNSLITITLSLFNLF